jgi:hypothetical protein
MLRAFLQDPGRRKTLKRGMPREGLNVNRLEEILLQVFILALVFSLMAMTGTATELGRILLDYAASLAGREATVIGPDEQLNALRRVDFYPQSSKNPLQSGTC